LAHILITGGSGQLGFELKLILGKHAIAPSSSLLDIESPSSTRLVVELAPDAVIHCAAETNVDRCEDFPDKAFSLNVRATQHMAESCRQLDIPLVYISTDYVFDGCKNVPYVEDDPVNPINIYGLTKLKGEQIVRELLAQKHYIVRTGWLYGFSRPEGTNFIGKILEKLTNNSPIQMITRQVGNPTSAHDLAHAVIELINTQAYGTYHLVQEGYCSRYEYTKKILECIGRSDIIVEPIETYRQHAVRPWFTALENVRARKLGIELQHWEIALKEFLSRAKRTYKFTPGGFVWD
jgi:dTDP-4-dehydrorhamnose reductase